MPDRIRPVATGLRPLFWGAVLALAAGPALAVTFDQVSGPKSFPPAGFKGNQFVDSAGCVFMRAGYAGQTTWIPRVTRDRQVICGQTPSFPESAAPVIADTPAVIVPPPVEAPRARTDPMPTVASTTAAPALRATVPQGRRVDPASYAGVTPVVRAAPPVVVAPAPVVAPVVGQAGSSRLPPLAGPCTNVSPLAQKLMVGDARHPVRCGPQQGGAPVSYSQVILPAPVKVPPGYVPAWEDDRLNPLRGRGTPVGDAAMAQVWTDTTPMRAARQRPSSTAYVLPRQAVTVSASSKSEATAPAAAGYATKPASSAGRYVQVGSFGAPGNAEAAAARLRAAGLPVTLSRIERGGRSLQVVMAGPVAPGAIAGTLGTARALGFGDAFIR